jgi:hypothetical protein
LVIGVSDSDKSHQALIAHSANKRQLANVSHRARLSQPVDGY